MPPILGARHGIRDVLSWIQLDLQRDPEAPKPGQVWKHYKGTLYRITGLCMFEENENFGVLYQAEQDPLPLPWMRPLKDWKAQVCLENGTSVPRFQLVN